MFIWNSIFFSFAFDGTDQFKELGGDSAAHAAAVRLCCLVSAIFITLT